jgi:hypothetical protein
MKQSSSIAKLLKVRQAARTRAPESRPAHQAVPGGGRAGAWKWPLALLFIMLTAGTSYAVLHFFVLSKIPHQMVGTWVVMEVKTTGGDMGNESLKGGRMQFHRDGTMICQANMDGKGYTIKATVDVEGEILRITTVNPNNGQKVTDEQTIRTLEGDRLVIEDHKGTVLIMERLRQ